LRKREQAGVGKADDSINPDNRERWRGSGRRSYAADCLWLSRPATALQRPASLEPLNDRSRGRDLSSLPPETLQHARYDLHSFIPFVSISPRGFFNAGRR
jgi:hypothetical protein